MFPSSKKGGVPIGPAVISHRLRLLLKHAGCRQARFHDLRHTFATNALEYGMDIKTLSTVLGHVSTATTLNVYSHITDEMLDKDGHYELTVLAQFYALINKPDTLLIAHNAQVPSY